MTTDPLTEATNFDHWSGELAVDPYPTLGRLRDACPVARSEHSEGFWLFTRFDDVGAALKDHDTFSSTTISIPRRTNDFLPVPPLDQDPPAHTRYRQMLLPFFTPQRTARLEPVARDTARSCAADVAAKGGCEGMAEYAFPMPTVIVASILGVPAGDQGMFCDWLVKIVETAGVDPKGAVKANQELYAYLGVLLEARRSEPRDDLLSFLLDATLEDRPLTREEHLGIAALLLVAGIDTTANTLGMALWHLARDLDAQRELRSRPELLGTAVEEFLRAYSPVSIARIVTTQVTVGECPIARDDMVLLSLPSANRDDRKYEDADKIVLDRAINPHVAFGLGIHRCLGAHIARMELRVGLEEFFAAVPEFRLVDPDAVTWKPGPIRGPREFVLEF
jgi:cytochrome P450